MPKTPAPPLYFHLSQRLLYWQSLPPCYAQLFHPPPNEAQLDPESLPPSNAAEIGLVEEDEKLYEEVDYAAEPVSNRVEREGNEGRGAERDVRRGGYPTFSGGGMTDPKKQVPMGIVERGSDGRVVRFVGDEGGGVGRPQPQKLARAGSMPVELDRTRRDIGDSENVRRSHAETGVSLTVSKRRKEVPPADQSLCPALAPQPVRGSLHRVQAPVQLGQGRRRSAKPSHLSTKNHQPSVRLMKWDFLASPLHPTLGSSSHSLQAGRNASLQPATYSLRQQCRGIQRLPRWVLKRSMSPCSALHIQREKVPLHSATLVPAPRL